MSIETVIGGTKIVSGAAMLLAVLDVGTVFHNAMQHSHELQTEAILFTFTELPTMVIAIFLIGNGLQQILEDQNERSQE